MFYEVPHNTGLFFFSIDYFKIIIYNIKKIMINKVIF